MSTLVKKIIQKVEYIVRPQHPRCPHPHSFSQEGEDKILAEVFRKSRGFYIDVGAHDPIRFSNTYYFYLLGWSGINIDSMPGSMVAFQTLRPRDINLEMAISAVPGHLLYHIFNETALNTFDPILAKERDGNEQFRIVRTQVVKTHTLEQVLDEYMPAHQPIDFMSVDVEGLDLEVLRSNNWQRFSPRYVLGEDYFAETVEQAMKSPIALFLGSIGYELFAKTAHTQVFRRHQFSS